MLTKHEIMGRCDRALEGNWSKIGFAAALFVMLSSVVLAVFGVPALLLAAQGPSSVAAVIPALFLLIVMYALVFILVYGFFVLIIRFYKAEYVTLGFLFYGFRDWRRLVRASGVFMIALFVASLLSSVPLLYLLAARPDVLKAVTLELAVVVTSFITLCLFFLMIFPFVYALYFLYETAGTNQSVVSLCKRSAAALSGKKKYLFSVCVSYARRELLGAALAFVVSRALAVPFPANPLSLLLGFANSVLLYLAWIKVIAVVTVFFYTCGPDTAVGIEAPESREPETH